VPQSPTSRGENGRLAVTPHVSRSIPGHEGVCIGDRRSATVNHPASGSGRVCAWLRLAFINRPLLSERAAGDAVPVAKRNHAILVERCASPILLGQAAFVFARSPRDRSPRGSPSDLRGRDDLQRRSRSPATVRRRRPGGLVGRADSAIWPVQTAKIFGGKTVAAGRYHRR